MTKRPNNQTVQLCNQNADPAALLNFEAQLAKRGLLEALEETGILPKVINPNPHDPVTNTVNHDRWWRDHKTEMQDFRKRVEDRQKALRQLHAVIFLLLRDC